LNVGQVCRKNLFTTIQVVWAWMFQSWDFFSGGFSCECKTPILHGQDLPKSELISSREDLSATIERVLVSVRSFAIWNFGCVRVIVVW
jgi:hypothetical protein